MFGRIGKSTLRDLADEDVMARFQDGDARAFEVIFDRHAAVAFSLAYRICGRRAIAEDIVQESFLSLWRSGARYDPTRGSVRSWILGTVHNRAIDSFRKERLTSSRNVGDEGLAERLPAPQRTEAEIERRDDARQVRAALITLPEEQRRVIELAYFGGFSHTEIADLLGLPAGTVKGRMRLGLTKMRVALAGPADVML